MTTDRHDPTNEERRSEERSERPDDEQHEQRDATSTFRRLRSAGVPKSAGTLLLVALLLPFLLFAVPQMIGADHGFVILSGSMEPALSPGDVVIISDSASVQIGDVITFDGGDTVPITHRIIGVEDGQYITKGDANENVDGAPVPPANVLGRVVLTIPVVGYVILWANTPVGQILLVVVPLVALGVSSLYRWANEDPETGGTVDAKEATDIEHAVDGEHAANTPQAATATDRQSPDSDVTANPDSDAGAPLETGLDALADAIGTADATSEPLATGAEDGTVAVTAPDLTLTLVSTAILAGYAAWNVGGEIGATGAPEPVSVTVLTAGLLGVGFALWTTAAARRAQSAVTGIAAAEEPTAADGGVDVEEGT